jgi:hypothetical protein
MTGLCDRPSPQEGGVACKGRARRLATCLARKISPLYGRSSERRTPAEFKDVAFRDRGARGGFSPLGFQVELTPAAAFESDGVDPT